MHITVKFVSLALTLAFTPSSRGKMISLNLFINALIRSNQLVKILTLEQNFQLNGLNLPQLKPYLISVILVGTSVLKTWTLFNYVTALPLTIPAFYSELRETSLNLNYLNCLTWCFTHLTSAFFNVIIPPSNISTCELEFL